MVVMYYDMSADPTKFFKNQVITCVIEKKIHHGICFLAFSPCAIHQTQIDFNILRCMCHEKLFSCHVPSVLIMK